MSSPDRDTDRERRQATQLAGVSPYQNTMVSDQGPDVLNLFNLNYLLLGPVSKYSPVRS